MYMDMDILLDFIRAERDGNWTLLLEAFTAMLPWLTIYDYANYARWGHNYVSCKQETPSIAIPDEA